MLAIISGGLLNTLASITSIRKEIIRTPYGLPSAPIYFCRYQNKEIVFLARHGKHYTFAPHEINYQANIWALQHIGVTHIISISAVTGLTEKYTLGDLIIPHDIIDYTSDRAQTFTHNAYYKIKPNHNNQLYSQPLREKILAVAKQTSTKINSEAIYACVQGPRLPTNAEANRFKNDGADIIGMTGMPEAILAKELNIAFTHVCGLIDYTTQSTIEHQKLHALKEHNQQIMDQINRLLIHIYSSI